MIFQLIMNLAVTGIYGYFLYPFKYKNHTIGVVDTKECFATSFSPETTVSIEQVYSPYRYNGTAEQFQA